VKFWEVGIYFSRTAGEATGNFSTVWLAQSTATCQDKRANQLVVVKVLKSSAAVFGSAGFELKIARQEIEQLVDLRWRENNNNPQEEAGFERLLLPDTVVGLESSPESIALPFSENLRAERP